MKPITKNQVTAIQTLISQKGLREEKARIISEASACRTCSTKELTFEEAKQLINFLNTRKELPNAKMMRKLFAMAHETGMIHKAVVVTPEKMKEQNNYKHLHDWVNKYGYLKKPLNDYNYLELPKLVSQFEFGPYKSFLTSKNKI
jgi:hypothetical protein